MFLNILEFLNNKFGITLLLLRSGYDKRNNHCYSNINEWYKRGLLSLIIIKQLENGKFWYETRFFKSGTKT